MFDMAGHKGHQFTQQHGGCQSQGPHRDEKPIGLELGWSGVIGFGFLGLALIFYMVVAMLPGLS